MDRRIIIPDLALLPRTGWSITPSGYVCYTSKKRRVPPFLRRGTYLHRAVIACLQGRHDPLPPDLDVHHMDMNKLHNCPPNLMLCPAILNRRLDMPRCPYTGQIMSRETWWRLYGNINDEPDWVKL